MKDECYTDFARYMSDVAKYYVNEGYPVTHISPVNEPQYNWDSGQEGSGWTNDEVARLIRELDTAMPVFLLIFFQGNLEIMNISTNLRMMPPIVTYFQHFSHLELPPI